MKITKRQLRRIIKEEKARLNEMYPVSSKQRAVDLYFDVNLMERLSVLVDEMYENAMDAAMDDIGPDSEEADMLVREGLRLLFLRETNKRR